MKTNKYFEISNDEKGLIKFEVKQEFIDLCKTIEARKQEGLVNLDREKNNSYQKAIDDIYSQVAKFLRSHDLVAKKIKKYITYKQNNPTDYDSDTLVDLQYEAYIEIFTPDSILEMSYCDELCKNDNGLLAKLEDKLVCNWDCE